MRTIKEPSVTSRAAALAAGLYQTSVGTFLPLREVNDYRLVNALLKALAAGEPDGVTVPLAAEVDRRGLRGLALATVADREAEHG